MADELIRKKLVNALFKGAEASPAFTRPGSAITLGLARRVWGGLWVGGNVFLYRDRLTFVPNALNLKAHKAGSIGVVEVPLSIITSVQPKWGIVTGIVQVNHGRNQLIFRSFGSKAFARVIAAAAGLTR